MSGTAMKACPECAEHEYNHGKAIPECCGTCHGAGRASDVEAAPQAEVAELRAEVYGQAVDIRDATARARHATPGTLRVVRDVMCDGLFALTTDRGVFVGGGMSAVTAEFFAHAQGVVLALTTQLAERDAELATARADEMLNREAIEDLIRERGSARAEVERLTAREREANYLLGTARPISDFSKPAMLAWRKRRAAWLTGCKL